MVLRIVGDKEGEDKKLPAPLSKYAKILLDEQKRKADKLKHLSSNKFGWRCREVIEELLTRDNLPLTSILYDILSSKRFTKKSFQTLETILLMCPKDYTYDALSFFSKFLEDEQFYMLRNKGNLGERIVKLIIWLKKAEEHIDRENPYFYGKFHELTPMEELMEKFDYDRLFVRSYLILVKLDVFNPFLITPENATRLAIDEGEYWSSLWDNTSLLFSSVPPTHYHLLVSSIRKLARMSGIRLINNSLSAVSKLNSLDISIRTSFDIVENAIRTRNLPAALESLDILEDITDLDIEDKQLLISMLRKTTKSYIGRKLSHRLYSLRAIIPNNKL